MLKFRKYLIFLAVPTFVLGMVLAAMFSGPSKSKTIAYRQTAQPGAATAGGSIPLRIYPTEAFATPTPTSTPEPTPTSAEVTTATAQANIVPTPAPKPTAKPVVKPQPTPAPVQPTSSCSGGLTEKFICLLNDYRASKGKSKLSANSSLTRVALTHSQWMESTGTFSHTGEDGSKFFDRCALVKVNCRAENLALGAGSAENLLTMWKNSPGHNANLLGAYSTIGLGIAGNYITALFN